MDLVTIFIAIISLLICSLPFWFVFRNRKKNEKKIISEFSLMANGKPFILSKFEMLPDLAFGMDTSSKILYFKKTTRGESHKNVIDLSQFASCELLQTNRPVGSHGNTHMIPDLISFRFVPKDKQHEQVKLLIYKSEESGPLTGELQMAKEWIGVINAQLTSNN